METVLGLLEKLQTQESLTQEECHNTTTTRTIVDLMMKKVDTTTHQNAFDELAST